MSTCVYRRNLTPLNSYRSERDVGTCCVINVITDVNLLLFMYLITGGKISFSPVKTEGASLMPQASTPLNRPIATKGKKQ